MKTFKEIPREIPIIANASILIVGGGPAGFGACLSAARNNKNVYLVEQFGFLGGASTASLVTTLPYRYLVFDDGPKKVYEGVYKEYIDRLWEVGGISMAPEEADPWTVYSRDVHGSMIPADPEFMKYIYSEMLLEAGAEIMLHTSTVGIINENEVIKGIIVENASGRQAILADRIIDATGDGDVAARAGVPFSIGDKKDKKTLPATLMFFIGNVDTARLAEYMAVFSDPNLYKMLKKGEEKGEFVFRDWGDPTGFVHGPDQVQVRICQSMCRNGEVIVHGAHVVGMDGTNGEHLTRAEFDARKQMIKLYQYFKKRVPGFEKSYITNSAIKIGVRESRRIHGEYMLDKDEAYNGKGFKDVVLRNTSGLFEKRGIIYDFPYRCLVPLEIDNLLVAGRCVSVDSGLLPSMRNIGACVGTGQAAGTAAALSIEQGTTPRNIEIKALQDNLIQQNVNLGPQD
ncbi:FAD-dependent oxidoreductase [Thermodesulfobacteriota bacterium]